MSEETWRPISTLPANGLVWLTIQRGWRSWREVVTAFVTDGHVAYHSNLYQGVKGDVLLAWMPRSIEPEPYTGDPK